jgi:hypothetical protein
MRAECVGTKLWQVSCVHINEQIFEILRSSNIVVLTGHDENYICF